MKLAEIMITWVNRIFGSMDHQFATPRRRNDKHRLYCPSTEIKLLMEYLEAETWKMICLSLNEFVCRWSNLQLTFTSQFTTLFVAPVWKHQCLQRRGKSNLKSWKNNWKNFNDEIPCFLFLKHQWWKQGYRLSRLMSEIMVMKS